MPSSHPAGTHGFRHLSKRIAAVQLRARYADGQTIQTFLRSRLLAPLLVVLLTAGAIVGVTLLVGRVDSSRRAQLAIGSLTQTVTSLGALPFSADPAFNSSPEARSPHLAAQVSKEIQSEYAKISAGLSAASRAGASPGIVKAGRSSLRNARPAVATVYNLAREHGGLDAAGGKKVASVQSELAKRLGSISAVLRRLDLEDSSAARAARGQAQAGTAAAMILLLTVFAYFYFRSDRLARENDDLLEAQSRRGEHRRPDRPGKPARAD